MLAVEMLHALSLNHCEPTQGPLHFSGIRAVIRHVFPRLSSYRSRTRFYAAARTLVDCRVPSGVMAGEDTEDRLKEFIDLSQVPILTMNLLQALPRTPSWDRLKREGRLVNNDAVLESNVRFLRPYDEVVAAWRRCVAHAYDPERLFARFAHQVDATYAHRIDVRAGGKVIMRNVREAIVLPFNILLWVGLLSNYRSPFWRAVRHALRRGQIDAAFGMGLVGYHLIQFSREALRGEQNASFYSTCRKPSLGRI